MRFFFVFLVVVFLEGVWVCGGEVVWMREGFRWGEDVW